MRAVDKIMDELLEDTKIVRNNQEHLLTIISCAPADADFSFNVHVNPYYGELLDRNYEDNNGFIIKRIKEKYSIISGCALTERARQNISNSLFEFTSSYL